MMHRATRRSSANAPPVAINNGPDGSVLCALARALVLLLELGLGVAGAALVELAEEPSRFRGGNDDDDDDDDDDGSDDDGAVEPEEKKEEVAGMRDGDVLSPETRIPFCTMISSAPSIRRVSKLRKCKEPAKHRVGNNTPNRNK
jgi:hypothetical protein